MIRLIYLDHAATTPLKEEVLQAMMPYLQNQYANASGSYAIARQVRCAIDTARTQMASLIGAKPQEVYATSGGTEADNWAISGAVRASKRTHIITSAVEHAAVLRTCEALERDGYRVTYLPVDENGVVKIEELNRSISEDTALVSIMLANNEVGVIQPISEIAEIAHRHGALMHTDAVQAVGHIPVDVKELGVDLLSLSAHKFYGPKGTGALYIRKGVKIERLIYGGEQEMGLRAGTENAAGLVGMGKAAQLAGERIGISQKRLADLRDAMVVLVKQRIPGAVISGEGITRLPGHVHLTFADADTSLVLMQLDMMGIAASGGSACAAGSVKQSHVMRAMGYHSGRHAHIRFSLGEENTYEEIERAVDALAKILLQ